MIESDFTPQKRFLKVFNSQKNVECKINVYFGSNW